MKTPRTPTSLVPIVAAIMALTLAGCTPSGQEATSPLPSTGAAPSTTDPNQPFDWGPMAVVPPPEGTDLALAEGVIRITDTCVVLNWTLGATLLYWPADRARWVPESNTIQFANSDGTFANVHNGARVAIGGSGDSVADGGLPGDEWVNSMSWIVPPDPACPLDQRWGVGYVEAN